MGAANYTYTLSHPTYSWTAKPLLNGSGLNWVKDTYRAELRKEWNGDVIFLDDPKDGTQDYSLIAAITDPSVIFEFDVYKDGSLYWQGQFTRYDCDFDEDQNTVKVTPITIDNYTTLLAEFEKETNILEWSIARQYVTSRYVDNNVESRYDSTFIGAVGSGNPIPTSVSGYVDANYYIKVEERYRGIEDPLDPGIYEWEKTEWYKREYRLELTSTPITGWYADPLGATTVVGGVTYYKFVRPYLGYTVATSVFTKSTPSPYFVVFALNTPVTGTITYKRCMALNEILFRYAGIYGLNYKSTFLSDYTNPVTGDAPSKTAAIFISQKSDILRPKASDYATSEMMSPRWILETLCDTFNLRWFIESYVDASGTSLLRLRIEHISWFSKQVGIDVSSGKYADFTRSTNKYSFPDPLPRYERWKFNDVNTKDFVGEPIEYAWIKNTEQKTIEYSVGVTTDIENIQENGEDLSDDGWVMLATTYTSPDNNLVNDTCLLTGAVRLNGHMAISNLQYNYWRHDRPSTKGKVNLNDITFLSTKKIKEQTEITIPIIEPVATNKLITTTLGDGEIESATEDLENESLKLKLRYA